MKLLSVCFSFHIYIIKIQLFVILINLMSVHISSEVLYVDPGSSHYINLVIANQAVDGDTVVLRGG